MKYILSIAFIFLILFSCRKDTSEVPQFKIGIEDENTTITIHDITVDAETYNGFHDEQWIDLDLDNSGSTDIRVFSHEDTINFPANTYYSAWIHIVDDQFKFAAVEGSDVSYETTNIEYDYYGTFPRKTYVVDKKCEYSDSAISSVAEINLQYFDHGTPFIDQVYWYDGNNNLILNKPPLEDAHWEFSSGSDSLIGQYFTYHGNCNPPLQNKITYVVFKKTTSKGIEYGWVEIKITNENAVYVGRSAITNKF